MDKIEELARGKIHNWRSVNAELVMFYNDAAEEMEKMLEYEGTFFWSSFHRDINIPISNAKTIRLATLDSGSREHSLFPTTSWET